MCQTTNIDTYCSSPLHVPHIVNVVTDVHQINDGYGIPRLTQLFHPRTCVSSAVVPIQRHKKTGGYVNHTAFVIYYSCTDFFHGMCDKDCDILVFKKSQTGGNLLNLRVSDVRMANAAIDLYVPGDFSEISDY
jgi:hypothetical protein